MIGKFIKKENTILQVISGDSNAIKNELGEGFQILDATTAEGAGEKHLPVVTRNGNQITVSVGSVLHPMTEEHSIDWIYLETKEGGQLKKLDATKEPTAQFVLNEKDEAIAVYAYCNLHGFWETKL